jgi:hypothetical protein
MTKLIITPDDPDYKEEVFTFLAYDIEKKTLLHKHPKIDELDCLNLENQGRSTFRPFGITYGDDSFQIVSHDRVAKFDLSNYERLGMIDVPLFVNTHQILKSGHILYATNTSNDTIGIYDLVTGENKFLSVIDFQVMNEAPTPSDAHSHDKSHVNSIYEYENKIYFCLHNLGKTMSQFGYFDKDTLKGELIGEAGYCAHNIVVINNHLYSLSSGTGEIIEINLETKNINKVRIVNEETTFLRGLDVYENKLFIGCSNNHNSYDKETNQKIIYENNCYIMLLDIMTGNTERYMYMPDVYVITDLRILPQLIINSDIIPL